jgi:AbrB family looped-hinge helix DNA binding protein
MAHTELKGRTRIEGNGRIVIPAAFRSALGLKAGDEIDLRIQDNEICISTLETRLAKSRQRLRTFVKPGRLLSNDLIAERRRTATNEQD